MQHQQHQQHPLHHHALHQRSRYQLNRFSPPSPSAAVAPEPLFAIDRSSSSSRVSPSSLSSSLAAAAAASQPLKQQQPQPSLPQTQPLPKQPPAPTAPASPVAPNADRRFQTPSLTIPAPSNSINPLSQQQQSGGITFRRPSLAQYGALSPNDTTSSSYRKAMTLIGSLSRSLGKNGGASLAMSLSRSLGKSWTRDAFLETLVNHLAPTSPMIAPSPGRDLAQFAVLEDQFCKDFACCGFNLETLHDLLQHFEECHVRLESDFEYGDDEDGGGGDGDHLDDFDDDDDADLPFEFDDGPDDEDMDMDCADQIPAFAQQQRHQFTTAELAASLQNAASAAAAAHTAEMPIANVSNNVNHFGRHTTMLQRSNSSPTRRATPASLLNVSAAPSNSNNAAPLSAFDTSVIRKRTLERHNSSPETSRSSLVGLNTAVPDKRRRQPHPLRSHIDAAPAPTIPFSVETKPDPMRDHDMDMDEDWLEQLTGLGAIESCEKGFDASELDFDDFGFASRLARQSAPLGGPPTPTPSSIPHQKSASPTPEAEAAAGADGDDRPFKCRVAGCNKAYKNPGGIKYHMRNGHAEDLGDPEINSIIQKPYQCPIPECAKRYKNLNGLKYHIEHVHISLLGVIPGMDEA